MGVFPAGTVTRGLPLPSYTRAELRTGPLGPHMAWLTARGVGAVGREKIRARIEAEGPAPQEAQTGSPRRQRVPHLQPSRVTPLGGESQLQAGPRGLRVGSPAAPAPARAWSHPSWSDPIKVPYKGKKKVARGWRGGRDAASGFVPPSPRDPEQRRWKWAWGFVLGGWGYWAQWGGSAGSREAGGGAPLSRAWPPPPCRRSHP